MKNPLHSLAAALLALALPLSLASCSGGDDKGQAAVRGVALSRNTMTLAAGDAAGRLTASVYPAADADKGVAWASAHPDIATVKDGVVAPLKEGKTTITATSAGGIKAECRLEVVAEPIPAIAAAPNKYATTIGVGGKEAFVVTFWPENATNQNLTWRSSDEAVAVVSAAGEVTAKGAGTATITATPEAAVQGAPAVAQGTGGADGPAPTVGDGAGGMDISVTISATNVAVADITLNKSAMALTVGNTETLIPTVLPENATSQAVNWISSDTAKAVVSSGGVVTALSPGTAVVTVATVDGGRMATCTVNVSPAPAEPVHPTGVTLDETSLTLQQPGDAYALTPTVLPSDATNKSVYWLTSNPGVAVVSSNGLVTAVAPGTATITVATADGGKKATCAVTVPVPVTGVTLNKSSMVLGYGCSERLVATVLPHNATNKNVKWYSASLIAVDDNGLVTANDLVTDTVTVRTEDGYFSATCEVTVVFLPAGGPDVYVVGHKTDGERHFATLWQNGRTPVRLSANESEAHSVFVSGAGDVYVAGHEYVNNEKVATLWKNGVPVHLSSRYYGLPAIEANSVSVSANGDVYVAGVTPYANDGLWKNGEPVSLKGEHFTCDSVFVAANGDVYVAGVGTWEGSIVGLWKNGEPFPLTDASGTVSVAVTANGDVYAVGNRRDMEMVSHALLWKNSEPPRLLGVDAWALSVAVSGAGDVYVAGIQDVDPHLSHALLWKNSEPPVRLSPVGFANPAYSVFVSATGDVYVAGSTNSFGLGAVLWKNGTELPLGSYSHTATSVFVK
jgi:uncharacterized protein YjdB